MNPSLAAVSAFGLRAPETFETAISAGARHMASERLARDMQGYTVGCICVADPSVTYTVRPGAVPNTLLLRCARRSVPLISAWRLSAGGPLCRRRPWRRRRPVCGRMLGAGGSKDSTRTGQ